MPVSLPADRELGRGAERRRLGLLAAGVRVDLGVEHEDVHVVGQREHVVEAAEADVVGPAVAADDPDGLLHEVVGEVDERPGGGRCGRRELHAQPGHALALGRDAGVGRLIGLEDLAREAARKCRAELAEQLPRVRRRGCRARAACRGRTPRCPRRGSWTRPGRARRGRRRRAWSGGCRRRSSEQPVALAMSVRSPKSCVSSLMYGVSPQPAHAPEYSKRGVANCEPLTSMTLMRVRSGSGRSRKKA